MLYFPRALPTVLLALALPLAGCDSCGFDCNRNSNNPLDPATLTLGFSDEAVEDLKEVVLEVDSIRFVSSDTDVVVDTFTIDSLGLVDEDTFTIDLLQYRGRNQLLVITDLDLEARSYSAIRIDLPLGSLNGSYVLQSDDSRKQLNASSDQLRLPGISLSEGSQQYTAEFNLAQSLRYRSGSDDYLISSDGIRVENTATAASLSGRVDSSLFDTEAPCDSKTEPTSGNRVYLYAGTGLTGTLGDVYRSDSSTEVPADTETPFATGTLLYNPFSVSWEYAFGYLPAGDYTLAFSCDVADDDPVDYDGYTIPFPSDQVYEITLSDSEPASCNLATGASCP